MHKKTIISLMSFALVMTLQSGRTETEGAVHRENTEWCNMWITSAQKNDKPRILMIGDSITNGYFTPASKALADKAYGAKFTTSACVADPAFLVQLEGLLSQYSFAVIHFNNGLHGFTYTEEEYQAGYERALQYIKKKFPSAKLVLALSTPLKSTSNKNELNPRVDARNEVVRALAKKYAVKVNDLHSISKGHPEYYSDPYHYKKEAVELQAKQVAEVLNSVMSEH